MARGSPWYFPVRAIALAAAGLLAGGPARADYGVISPDAIDFGYLVIQHDGDVVHGRRTEGGGAQGYTVSLGTGLTTWWDCVVELGYDHAPADGEPSRLTQAVIESTFEFTHPGEAFVDLGLYVEYGQTLTSKNTAKTNEFTFGPAIGKDIGRTTHTLNLLFTRLLGPDQTATGLDFGYAWQSRWNIWEMLSPAVEIYGDTGPLGRALPLSRQHLLAGPVALGSVGFEDLGIDHAGRLKYEIGWLFGATPATAAGTLRWHLELEIPF